MCAIAVDEAAQCREGNTCAANRASQEKKKLNVIVEEISEDRGFNQTSLFLWRVQLVASLGFVLGLRLSQNQFCGQLKRLQGMCVCVCVCACVRVCVCVCVCVVKKGIQ